MQEKVFFHSRASRLFHWSFALSIILLLLSGFYIHRPVDFGVVLNMGQALFVKAVISFASMGIFTGWVYYLTVTGDYRHQLFRLRNIRELPALGRYYIFIDKQLPPHDKYNAGQKLVYTSWFFFFIFQAVSGMFLTNPAWANYIPPLTLQHLRFYHYLGAVYFLGTVPIHIYLAFTEDPSRLQAIFSGWIKKPGKDSW